MAKLLWTLKQQVGPQPRAGHAMSYDSQAGRALLFGGLAPVRLADTWQWDGENWTQVDDLGPGPRSESAMAYDAERQRTVLFGGTDGNDLLNDTWEWDGEDWTQVANSGLSARTGHAMTFDLARKRILLFGGATASENAALGDTWVWDGNEWVQVEDTGPVPRQAAAMAFDTRRNRAVLFGGADGAKTFGDTWEWDATSWTQVSSYGPPPCLAATMVYTGYRALLFGGVSGRSASATLFGNSWEWDGRHWTIRQDMGPGARWGHGMVFDTGRSRGVLFGGAVTQGESAPSVLGDTWEQFDTAPRAQGEVIVQSVTATPDLQTEGQPISISVRLSGAPTASGNLRLVAFDAMGRAVFNAEFSPVEHLVTDLVLSEGQYRVSAQLGETASKSVAVRLNRFQANATVSLVVSPTPVPRLTPFTLTATLSIPNPLGRDLYVPLRASAEGLPSVWSGQPLKIPSGESTGQVTIQQGFFPGTWAWVALLAGHSSEPVTLVVT